MREITKKVEVGRSLRVGSVLETLKASLDRSVNSRRVADAVLRSEMEMKN